jgi:very-short-patch-repair endonuclease
VVTRQSGVISREQLLAVGVDSDRIRYALAAGRLHRVHRGVYAVGHPTLTHDGRLWAALLACGPDAVISHRSAARLHGLITYTGRIEVTATKRVRDPSLSVHRSRTLTAADRTTVDGIPTTTVTRTIIDLADVAFERLVERALNEAERQRLHLGPLDAPGRRGAAKLRRARERQREGETVTRSELEERFLELVRAAGLPQPRVNARLHGYEVDFHWPAERLVVEVDGADVHATRRAVHRDRERDLVLREAGLSVMRLTWRHVTAERGRTAARLAAALTTT